MVGKMVQNSQMSYSFTFNDLILIHEYIHSHSTTYFFVTNIFIHSHDIYSFTFNEKKNLCNTVAIFIQHFVNSAKFTNSIFIHF